MHTIAQNSFYQLAVHQEKNRMYLKVAGTWSHVQEVPLYLQHLKEALALVKPGFSIITDIRELEFYSPVVKQMHLKAQKMTVKAGIFQLAEVHYPHTTVNELSVSMAQESKIPLNIFDSMEDAEAWLDDLSPR
jgi:hypothetical protein